MNVFAFLSLGSSFICAFLGLTVFILNRKALLNKIFTVILLVGAYWAFCEFMLHQANNVEVAVLWTKALFLWPFLLPLMVHFTLVFTENSLIKKKVTYVLLYGPALIFSVIDLATNLISSAPVRHYWGFDYA